MKLSRGVRLPALALIVGLSGCAVWKAATFQSHPASFVKGKDMLVTIGPVSGMTPEMQKWCGPAPPNALVGASLAPVITAVLSGSITLISDEINAYLDAKAKEFTKSMTASTNAAQLFLRTGNVAQIAAECIVVQMTADGSGQPDDFDFAGRLITSGARVAPTGYSLQPTFYRLNRSAARTGMEGKVDITVEIAISAVAESDKGVPILAGPDAKIALSDIKLPAAGVAATAYTQENDDKHLGPKNQTPWFTFDTDTLMKGCVKKPSCTGIMPANITVTLTETGSGSPDFGLAKTELTDASKALSQGLQDLVKANTAK